MAGVGIAFALRAHRRHRRCSSRSSAAARAATGRCAGAGRGADELVGAAARRPAGWLGRARRGVLRRGARAPGPGARRGARRRRVGWVVDTQTEVRSDLPQLVPQDLAAVRDLETLQATTGVAGEVDVVVEAATSPIRRSSTWMQRFQQRVLEEARYSPDNGCGKAALCPALSLPDLFPGEGATDDAARIDALLDAVPPYFSQAVITEDRRTANLAFGIRLMPLDEQHDGDRADARASSTRRRA